MGGVYDSGGGRQGSSRDGAEICCFKKTRMGSKTSRVLCRFERVSNPTEKWDFYIPSSWFWVMDLFRYQKDASIPQQTPTDKMKKGLPFYHAYLRN
jgi:hypothetical protein